MSNFEQFRNISMPFTFDKKSLVAGSLLDDNINDFNIFIWFVVSWICFDGTNLLTNIHSFNDATKDCMFVIKPWLKQNKIFLKKTLNLTIQFLVSKKTLQRV